MKIHTPAPEPVGARVQHGARVRRAHHPERRGHAAIAGIGTALPPGHSQQDLWDSYFREYYRGRRVYERLWTGCGVEFRHGVAAKFGLEISTWSTERRMRQFIEDGVPLGASAINAALAAAGVSPGEVEQLTVVSCTGYATPGLDTLLIDELGLDARVQRLHIGHMGCHAALPGLTVMSDAAVARGQVGVMLCLELTSLHIQPPAADVRQLLVHALFSDAAAALVVVPSSADAGGSGGSGGSGEPGGNGLEMIDFVSITEPAAARMMTWDVTDLGFAMGISTKVPEVVRRHVEGMVAELLGRHGLRTRDVAAWAVHPGGPEILDVVEKQLRLPTGALEPSRTVLREHGNCSSPTVLLVLDEIMRESRPASGKPVVALAFGPGLTLCAALFRTCG